jgi:DnaK suppressor protein
MSSDAVLADLRALLEQERDELRRQIGALGFGDEGFLSYDANFADSSQVTAERGEAEALAATLRETLVEVEHALAKFESGRYGLCEQCERPIPPARLEAKPAARFCIDCASRR